MSIKIITDSTSDIGLAEARSLGISVVLLKTVFEDGEYLDGVDLTAESSTKNRQKPNSYQQQLSLHLQTLKMSTETLWKMKMMILLPY